MSFPQAHSKSPWLPGGQSYGDSNPGVPVAMHPPRPELGGAEICPPPGDSLGLSMLETQQPGDFPSLLPLMTLAKMLPRSGPRPWHQSYFCEKPSIVPKAERGQDRRALVTDEKTEVQRDKVTCPRSHSWAGGEVGPGVLILLTWS